MLLGSNFMRYCLSYTRAKFSLEILEKIQYTVDENIMDSPQNAK